VDVPIFGEPLIDDREPLIVDTKPLIVDKNPLLEQRKPPIVDKDPLIEPIIDAPSTQQQNPKQIKRNRASCIYQKLCFVR